MSPSAAQIDGTPCETRNETLRTAAMRWVSNARRLRTSFELRQQQLAVVRPAAGGHPWPT